MLKTQSFHSVLAFFLLLITLDIFKTLFVTFFFSLQDPMSSRCLMSSLSNVSFKLKKKIIYIFGLLRTNCEYFKVAKPSTLLFSETGKEKDNWNYIYILNILCFFCSVFSHCPEDISAVIIHWLLKPNQNLPTLSYF